MATPEEKQFFVVVEQNDLDAVKRYIEENNIRVSVTNFKQETAAHIAVRNNNVEMLKFLISRDRELLVAADDTNFTVLHVAVKRGFLEIVKYLIEDLQVDIFASENRFCGDTAVHMAAEEDQLTILKYFLEERKIDVNVKDEIGGSPLFLAAEKVRMRIIKYLIEDMQADATIRDFQKASVLFRSAEIGDVSVPKYLLDERKIQIGIDWMDNFSRTILHNAARYDGLEFIKYFVEQKKANYDLADNLGNTPLHEAASEGHLDVVKYLVEKGANIDIKNNRGLTPSGMAKNETIVQYLNETTKTKTRSRRSALAFEPGKRSSRPPTKFRQVGLFYQSMRSVAMNLPRVEGHESLKGESSLEVSSTHPQSFLLIANAILMKNSKNLVNTNRRTIDLLSPQNTIDGRIDQLAINAVTEDHYFSIP